MTPMELMARLSAIIAPPRYPLVRYSGVLGPRSSWRRDVVPKQREPPRACDEAAPAVTASNTVEQAAGSHATEAQREGTAKRGGGSGEVT
jgi:hypothetical protein